MPMLQMLRRGVPSWPPWLDGLASGTFVQPCGLLPPRVRLRARVHLRCVLRKHLFAGPTRCPHTHSWCGRHTRRSSRRRTATNFQGGRRALCCLCFWALGMYMGFSATALSVVSVAVPALSVLGAGCVGLLRSHSNTQPQGHFSFKAGAAALQCL